MRAFSLGLAAVGLIVITPVPAAADTYLVVTNLTEEQQAIQVGAARVNYGESVWTPLGTKDAPQIIYPFHGGEVLAMDTQERCADDSGWAIDFVYEKRGAELDRAQYCKLGRYRFIRSVS